MPLRSLTNSSVRRTQSHRKTELSNASEFPTSSNNSGILPFLSADDGIYNAQRIASDEEPSIQDEHMFRPVYKSNHDRASGVSIRLRRKQALSEGNTAFIEHPSIQQSSAGVKADGHCRGWSLNDLDCAARMDTLFQNAISYRSPSSNEALETAANVTVYPHLPPRPPPCRKSTPDGIPSFGTREAQELRLVSPSRLHRLAKLIQRKFQSLEPIENVTQDAVNARTIGQSGHPATERPQFEGPTEMLRRVSGMVRPVYVTDGSRKFHRSALPKGVKMVSAPGDLTIAEDGSHVRGRFGNRVSGHGVGQRTMDFHPLARGQETSMIEEEVRAINKACDRQSLREQYQSGSMTTEYRSTSRVENGYLQSQARVQTNFTDETTVAQAIQNERRAVRALEEQRQQNIELRAALKSRQTPLAVPSITSNPPYTVQPSCSQNSSSTSYHSTQASRNVIDIGSSGSETIRPPRMIEPAPYAPYDVGRSRSTAALDSILVSSTIEETLEGQEQDQAFQEARQRTNRKSETEIC